MSIIVKHRVLESVKLCTGIFISFLFLGSHDVQDAVVTVGPMPGTVTVLVTYAVNTSAMGHLAILVNSSDMAVAFTAQDRSSQATTIRGLLADEYTALVFDIESNGLPSTAAADSEEVDVTEGADESLQTGALYISLSMYPGVLFLGQSVTAEC